MPLPLDTERLLLRPAKPEDLDAWHAISRDAEEAWFGAGRSTIDDSRIKLGEHIHHQEQHGFAMWVVELRSSGEVIGVTGLDHLDDGPEIEVGYRFLNRCWGRGYATEAARASIAYGFGELGLDRIVAVTPPKNVASRRVLEKCGMSFVGVMQVYGFAQVKYAIAR